MKLTIDFDDDVAREIAQQIAERGYFKPSTKDLLGILPDYVAEAFYESIDDPDRFSEILEQMGDLLSSQRKGEK